MANYEVWLTDDKGVRLGLIETPSRIEYVKKVDDDAVGEVKIHLPTNMNLFTLGLPLGFPDRRIEVWRGTDQTLMRREAIGFIRYLFVETAEDGSHNWVVSGPDQNELLKRRIVVALKNSAEALKQGAADDMMKELVAENLGSSASDPLRDITDWGFTVAADTTSGATIDIACEWLRLDDALRDIAAASYEEGTKVYYGIVPVSRTAFQFRTWTGQPGKDKSTDPRLIFSMDRGNLRYASREFDYANELTYAYAGGWGEEQERIVGTAIDQTRNDASAINRREGFTNAQSETAAGMIDEGYILLSKNRPIQRFYAEITDTEWTRYGVDWDVGDRVMVDFMGAQAACLVASVYVTVENEMETIMGRCEWQ